MGAAVGACLVAQGHQVGWVSRGRSAASRSRAESAGLRGFDDLGPLLAASSVVFSICPPHAAVDVARQVTGFSGTVVDANAVSPQTARQVRHIVESGGARYVDGGILGPPPEVRGTTRLYLAGDDGRVADLFTGSALDVIRMAKPVPAASALKMSYAAWTKTTAALLVSIRRTARALDVDDELAAEWARSPGDLPGQWDRAQRAAAERGWRWSYELAEVGRTFAAVGEPAGFGAAASQVFDAAAIEAGSVDAAAIEGGAG